jgi:hypothetical protein
MREPQAPDSLLAWGTFNTAFERKECMEDDVAEDVAREQMADPAVAKAFQQRLDSDPTFAGRSGRQFQPRQRGAVRHRRGGGWPIRQRHRDAGGAALNACRAMSSQSVLQRSADMKRIRDVVACSTLVLAALPALAQPPVLIEQQGSLGVAHIEQILAPAATASIVQASGVGSQASIRQEGMDVHIAIQQAGNRHIAQVRQLGDGTDLTISQTGGSDNTAIVEQSPFSGRLDVQQVGSRNQARIVHNGWDPRTDVKQVGTGNTLTLNQFTGVATVVSSEQRGTNHRADILWNTDGLSQDETVTLYQNGSDHIATVRGESRGMSASVTQDGANNEAHIDLTGVNSTGTIEQSGTGHRGYIVSTADGSVATIRQGGRDNLARITQLDSGGAATILQNTVTPGYGNVATIVQR